MAKPVRYAQLSPEWVVRPLPAEVIVSGDPLQQVQLYFSGPENRVRSGVWQCDVGAYRLAFGPTKHEFFHILDGRIRIHDNEGGVTELLPGDSGVIPAGFTGVFEVIEPARKHFVISE